ncbi:MAG: tRNA preQ1(34) S-adenosylmethionine ribosyltransferase-isomerase QueA [Rickettsiales bacterium]|jgi:S-adenosylmethionine:tRNA ribosyltransferase-isomerase|nr:tRNA preQ1(34) S-adenosylmethionine ribosyltransferase-isomerase QueA [Rickettsiales bacterium]
MLVSDFDFSLPDELIAQQPLERRDASRMLVVKPNAEMFLQDRRVVDFINFLQPGDVVVFNDTKVIPCRFDADGYEITLHTNPASPASSRKEDRNVFWWALCKKFNKLKIGNRLKLNDGTEIEIVDKNEDSGILIKFDSDNVFDVLERVGKMPLPPYIKRPENNIDRERYQTVYANQSGSMAAPTAGLHFTNDMIAKIKDMATIVNITLHVGAGTWMPVKVPDTRNHKMHSEWGLINAEQAEIINNARRVIAIGTTSLRLLESAAVKARQVEPFSGATDIFITPEYEFKVADVLLTNFHLPKSTLFMLVCAFLGTDEMKRAYAHAILEKYRFFSYGDCCLLFRKDK